MYDVTCIPLTGYSTDMPFDIGDHRTIAAIDERDIITLAVDMDISLNAFDRVVREVVESLETPSLGTLDNPVEGMVDRNLENSVDRLRVLKSCLG